MHTIENNLMVPSRLKTNLSFFLLLKRLSLLFMRKLSGKGMEPLVGLRKTLCQRSREGTQGTSGALRELGGPLPGGYMLMGLDSMWGAAKVEVHSFLCLSPQILSTLETPKAAVRDIFLQFLVALGRKAVFQHRVIGQTELTYSKETLSLNLNCRLLKQWALKKWESHARIRKRHQTEGGLVSWKEMS